MLLAAPCQRMAAEADGHEVVEYLDRRVIGLIWQGEWGGASDDPICAELGEDEAVGTSKPGAEKGRPTRGWVDDHARTHGGREHGFEVLDERSVEAGGQPISEASTVKGKHPVSNDNQ